MFTVNGNPLIADEQDVLEELRRQCSLNGNNLFRVFKPSGRDDIMTNCPFHKDGQERKPSFGISRVDGKCHCFTCGWAGTIDQMISEVFGHYDDGGDFGRKWLSKNFLTVAVESRKPLELNLSRGEKRQAVTPQGFTEQELDRYRYYHPYMYERGLTDEIIEEFDIGFDSDSQCITFPVYYADKTPAFVARRSVKVKFFNYPEGVEKPVYGAERFVSGKYSEAIICESFFNCLTCWKHGRPSMALIGTGTEYQYDVLKKLPVRKYVLAMDPDEAGRRAMAKLKRALGPTKIISYLAVPQGKDINDCDEVFDTLEEYF